MQLWRNWQTRTFEGRVGNHMGSSPIGRTKQKNHAKAWFFCLAKAGMSLEREAVAAGGRGRPPEQIPTVAQKKIDHFDTESI